MTGYEIAIRLPWNQQYLKYRNPDPRCTYPFTPDLFGYCWSYAIAVDHGLVSRLMRFCPYPHSCECWKEGAA